ncbi:MAG TPA: response regulator [Balneolaceae bacterium]|nr:two-component system response regulator [Balneola sp.]HBQ59434.1 response regulator [Balneolaceae bacterium]|tara:strand:+ start:44165 stop:44554 length:390 start_codon:yes stop_codon:yes gene_type:complete
MKKINVLIVEDDPAMRVVLRSTVLSAELDVEVNEIYEAENGKVGLEVLGEKKVDLMLVDIYMPVMDGMEMLDYTYDHPEWSKIPAIVVSTESDEDRIDAIQRKGMGFVHKPLTHLYLKDKINDSFSKAD